MNAQDEVVEGWKARRQGEEGGWKGSPEAKRLFGYVKDGKENQGKCGVQYFQMSSHHDSPIVAGEGEIEICLLGHFGPGFSGTESLVLFVLADGDRDNVRRRPGLGHWRGI